MRIVYDFDGVDFTYEPDEDEVREFILNSYTPDEILSDYIEYIYPKTSAKDKETFTDWGFEGTAESVIEMSEEEKEDFIDMVALDDLLEADVYAPEIEEHFEDEAYDAFSEEDEYTEWSREYNRQRL